ncbi:MAG TPA: cell division protein FtsA [Saprospiraceae bacterium]|nr:cell division protein FtsA [Saprospiraceae bacterium]
MKDMHIQNSKVAVALDIGTTKICAIAGRLNEYGKIEILGVGTVKSEGVSRGVVINIDKTVRSIRDAVEIAERNAGLKIKKVHVGIAGQHIKSLHHHGLLTRDNALTEISQADVDKLIKDMHKLVLPPGVAILHVIPQEFTVDDERDIMDPVGMSGIRLEANFHIITGQITASRNLAKCVEKAGLGIANLTLEPIASSSAVLNSEEMEAGVALVDIGGGTTDVTVFKDGIIRHTGVIPFGGHVITKDIQAGCSVLINQAEKLKVKFGSALADEIFDNRIITIPGINGREPSEISEKNLARIIQARVEEIFDQVMFEIKRSGYEDKLLAGMVLTGGGSMLRHIDLLSNYHTTMHTRIGQPIEHLAHGYTKQLASPKYATAVGLLKNSIDNDTTSEYVEMEGVPSIERGELVEAISGDTGFENGRKEEKWIKKLFDMTKDFFDPKPDSDF